MNKLSPAQERRFFAPMLQGGIGAFGLTEPGAGSDVAGGSTTAVRSGDDYVIDGAIRRSLQRAAWLIDEAAPFEVEAAMVKSFLARFGSRMLIDGCQIEGGLGISEAAPKGVRRDLPLARMFRDIAGTTLRDTPGDCPDRIIAHSLV
jgi:alkylation response protein AidB-like acyl-CoA dehydrogenase